LLGDVVLEVAERLLRPRPEHRPVRVPRPRVGAPVHAACGRSLVLIPVFGSEDRLEGEGGIVAAVLLRRPLAQACTRVLVDAAEDGGPEFGRRGVVLHRVRKITTSTRVVIVAPSGRLLSKHLDPVTSISKAPK